MRIAYLNAQLSLYDVKFSGKHFPKSADDLLNKSKVQKSYSKEQWLGLAKVLDETYGKDSPKKKKKGK